MSKKKPKTDLVLVGSMVPAATAEVLKRMAKKGERSVSKTIKKILEESSEFQQELKPPRKAAEGLACGKA